METTSNKSYHNRGNLAILNEIQGEENLRILDIGCGGGNLKVFFDNSHTVDGITISTQEAENGKPYARDIFIHNLEDGLPEIVKARKYDYVICSHVLEHICYPRQLLEDIKSIMSSRSHLIIAVPNLMHYNSRLKLLFGNFEYQKAGIWDYTHFRWYTYKSSRALLEKHKYKIEKHWVDGQMPLAGYFSWLPNKSKSLVFKFISGINPGLFGYQILVKARYG